jgi:hypothetical protein
MENGQQKEIGVFEIELVPRNAEEAQRYLRISTTTRSIFRQEKQWKSRFILALRRLYYLQNPEQGVPRYRSEQPMPALHHSDFVND